MDFKFPDATARVSICGATGSGKTRFGVWLFSFSQFKRRPHIIFDFKGDDLIAQIDRAEQIGLRETPKHPGLYIVRPTPGADDDAVTEMLWRIWKRGNTGLFFDEGYMVPGGRFNHAFNAILTQGRSLKIPTMTLTQRPSYCSRFVFSEAGYFAVFRLNDNRDVATVSEMTPKNGVFDFSVRQPEFTARWYDVGRDWSCLIDPVPGDDYILARYDDALKVRHRGV